MPLFIEPLNDPRLQEYPDKRITLYDIRDELTNRYADKRVPYHALTDEERFYLLCNETPEVCIALIKIQPFYF